MRGIKAELLAMHHSKLKVAAYLSQVELLSAILSHQTRLTKIVEGEKLIDAS